LESTNNKSRQWAHSLGKAFLAYTMDDFTRYHTIVLLMRLRPCSNIKLYWSKNPIYNCPVISSLMSRNFFLRMHNLLTFSDNLEEIYTDFQEVSSDDDEESE